MIKKLLFWFVFISIDVALYIIIGLILLNYEDTWDSTKGYYWSLGGMTLREKVAYISYYILIVINILIIIYLSFKFFKYLKKRFLP
ncbi:hypothetical protein DMZ43_00820 [Meridianimaribacter sp. CL38]|nr:hypothetical protein DMZ43_00820 [Meridianimaribacter sp. CL38]